MNQSNHFQFPRYKQNLRVVGNEVVSYTTAVAVIDAEAGTLRELGKWSRTTTKHVNYAAQQLGLKLIPA
jgi:hypothetical protein